MDCIEFSPRDVGAPTKNFDLHDVRIDANGAGLPEVFKCVKPDMG
jgi:hypothetical protein